jgi:3-(methylthio)propanoyl-CoA dehydrogenase
VHGGMGFIEETGAAQYVRDVRITTIYEGTTGIQSNDLIGRKLARDRGAAMGALLHEMEGELKSLSAATTEDAAIAKAALDAVGALRRATHSVLQALGNRPDTAMAVAVPYLKLCGYVVGGWLLARSAAIARRKLQGSEREFYAAKLRSATFYAAQVLPLTHGLERVVTAGALSVIETDAGLI